VVGTERPGGQLERWISFGTTFIAPATVLTGVLFYFGYVSSRAQYEYFGVDVDTIGLPTQGYVMRSPQPLLAPLLVLTFLGLGALQVHAVISRRIASTTSEDGTPELAVHYRVLAGQARLVGLAMIGIGIAMVVSYAYLREWAWFNLVTPLLLASGAGLVGYASRIQSLLQPAPTPPAATDSGPSSATGKHALNTMVALRRSASALIFVVIVANIFWATATVAQWSGRGVAHYAASHLDRLPSVILDTHERLFLHDPGVEETVLPAAKGQTFHYRYRHLRLLIQGHDLMFLVPDKWSASDSTLVVRLDGSVRVQFQFQNEAP
jgi:hypothetical protein